MPQRSLFGATEARSFCPQVGIKAGDGMSGNVEIDRMKSKWPPQVATWFDYGLAGKKSDSIHNLPLYIVQTGGLHHNNFA